MHIETKDKTLSDLLALYNSEIDTLKSKLLNGIPWEDLIAVRKNITELGLEIHRCCSDKTVKEPVFLDEAST